LPQGRQIGPSGPVWQWRLTAWLYRQGDLKRRK
jgi:hypothetical protein